MSGAGNDFIVIDNRERRARFSRQAIARLCHRKFGIGADGLLAVEPAQKAGNDFRMRYYNADGGEAEMCGNGARCIARFYHRLLTDNNARCANSTYSFETKAGVIRAVVRAVRVHLSMTEPTNARLNHSLRVNGKPLTAHNINTGVPHAVIMVKDVARVDVDGIGRAIRWHRDYQPAGTNVNFAQVTGRDSIRVRTYERGVEAETLACGTGVTASAIITHLVRGVKTPVRITTASGCELGVDFTERDGRVSAVVLSGPAEFVFEGAIALA
jgi:diaminopimelate epimerase